MTKWWRNPLRYVIYEHSLIWFIFIFNIFSRFHLFPFLSFISASTQPLNKPSSTSAIIKCRFCRDRSRKKGRKNIFHSTHKSLFFLILPISLVSSIFYCNDNLIKFIYIYIYIYMQTYMRKMKCKFFMIFLFAMSLEYDNCKFIQ